MHIYQIIQLNLWPRSRENPIYGGAVGAADCTLNPCAPIRFRRKQKVEIDRYLPAEWNRLESRLAGENWLYFSIMRATRMRPGEVLALEWSDYDGEKISVSKQVVRCKLADSTKTSVRRFVAVENWLRPMLDN